MRFWRREVNRFLIRSSRCASVSQVRHSNNATWSSPLWVMRSVTCVPLVLLLAISGFLSLYHAVRDGELSKWVTALHSVSESPGEGWAADRGPGPLEIHFCGVCAFTNAMDGALHVAYQEIPPPSQAPSTHAARSQVASRWLSLHPISRAPPTSFPG